MSSIELDQAMLTPPAPKVKDAPMMTDTPAAKAPRLDAGKNGFLKGFRVPKVRTITISISFERIFHK